MDDEDQVRVIAYSIWEDEGKPHGRHLDHWFRAEAICRDRERRSQASAVAETAAPRKVSPRAKARRPEVQRQGSRQQISDFGSSVKDPRA